MIIITLGTVLNEVNRPQWRDYSTDAMSRAPVCWLYELYTFTGMIRLVFVLIFSAVCTLSQGQTQPDSLRSYGTDSNLIQDGRVNELILKHILINEARKEKIKGFRVQIHFGPEKAKALEVKSKYNTEQPTSTAYLDYQQPYFKIRVGDFRTRLEAYKHLQLIAPDFPGAFIVQDDIELPRL